MSLRAKVLTAVGVSLVLAGGLFLVLFAFLGPPSSPAPGAPVVSAPGVMAAVTPVEGGTTEPGSATSVTAAEATLVDGGEIPLAPPPELVPGKWLITGRVVTEESAASGAVEVLPAVGVTVYYKPHPNRTDLADAPPPQRCLTGADGRFAFVGVPGRLWLRMEVDAPGRAYRTLSFKLSVPPWKGSKDIGDVLVEEGRDVELLVLGPREESVLGAEVLVGRKKIERSLSLEEAGIKESRRLATELGDGRYFLERAAPGSLRVQVRASGYSRFREYVDVPEDGPVVIRIREGLSIGGVVVDLAGEPIEGAELEIDGPNIGSPTPTTRTDEGGAFLFDILSGGEHTLDVKADGYVAATLKDVTAGVEDVRFELAPEGVIAGVVVDARSQRPIAGAEVRGENTLDGVNETATSDDQGRFRLGHLTGGTYTLAVDHDGYGSYEESGLEVQEGSGLEGRVVSLRAGLAVTGLVTDAQSGEGVAKALVTFERRDSTSGVRFERKGETDPDGRYRLNGFVPGEYRVTVESEDYLPAPSQTVNLAEDAAAAAEDEVFDFTLERGATVSGVVTSQVDERLAGVSVQLVSVSVQPRNTPPGAPSLAPRVNPSGPVKQTLTDADGRYRLRGIPPGTDYRVTAAHIDYVPVVSGAIELAPRESRDGVDLVLGDGATIRGRVLDAEGRPVMSARVDANWNPPPADPAENQGPDIGALLKAGLQNQISSTVRSLADGGYTIGRLHGGTYTVRARADGYLPATRNDVVLEEGQLLEEVDLILGAGSSITGTVLDAEGDPVAGATLRASGGSVGVNATSDLDGRFELEALPDGDARLDISKAGFVSQQLQVTVPGDAVTVRLDRSATVRGEVVVRGTGEAIGGANIRVELVDPNQANNGPRPQLPNTNSRGDGTFVLDDVPPGDFTLTVNHQDYSPASVALPGIRAGDLREVRLELGRGGGVRGVVAGVGAPLRRAEVQVFSTDGQGGARVSKSARTDADGAYELMGLPAGNYMLAVRASSREPRAYQRVQQALSLLGEEVQEWNFDLEAAVRVSGRIAAAGSPVSGGQVRFQDASGQGAAGASIDGAGNFQVDLPGAGTYTFQISGGPANGAVGEFVVPAGVETLARDIALSAGTIFGVAVDAETGAPVSGAPVFVAEDDARAGSLAGLSALFQTRRVTDGAGRFALEFLPPATYTVRIAAQGYAPAFEEGVRLAEGGEVELRFALTRGVRFTATVVDGEAPVSGVMAILRDQTGGIVPFDRPSLSDASGRLVLDGIRAGPYEVTLLERGHAPARYGFEATDGGEAVWTLGPAGTLEVSVVDRRGDPVAGALVEVLDERGQDLAADAAFFNGGRPSVTDARGSVTLAPFPVGTFDVRALRDNSRSRPERVTVREGEVGEALLTLR